MSEDPLIPGPMRTATFVVQDGGVYAMGAVDF